MNNFKLDKLGFDLLVVLEGLRLNPYKCTAGVWTIGFGSTFYENGTSVKENDLKITKEKAYILFQKTAKKYIDCVNKKVTSEITQNQFNALFCFCYNVGTGGFSNSTLLRMVNKNPNHEQKITAAFLMWKGQKNILLSRQKQQIEMYFKD